MKLPLKRFKEFWLRYRKNRVAVVGAIIAFVYVAIAIMAPYIIPYSPFELHLKDMLSPPSDLYKVGTDQLGRDLLSRVIWGTRISLLVGFSVTVISTAIGIIVGAAGAYLGGWLDEFTMRLTDFTYCLPTFFLVLIVLAFLGPNVLSLTVVMGVTMWPRTARLIRAEVLSLKEKDFVMASKVCGTNNVTLLFSEILPNAMYPVTVAATLRIATAILYEASLSFLGVGDPSLVSWGWIIHEALPFIRTHWWLPIIPGLTLSILVIAVNLVGDGLNDAFNPLLKER